MRWDPKRPWWKLSNNAFFWYLLYGSPGIKDTLGEMMLNLRDKIRDKTREISQKIKRRP